ncbi:GlmU family protein [Ravibacter arvi]|uniref:GlmU family protein n=1 Tax=Ravibacter arvi TaxID=2051041 RepID=A0ABP8LZ25_9BACT
MKPNLVLFDDPILRIDLLPFTYTRPIPLIRCGILSIQEKWERALPGQYSLLSDEYLQEKYPVELGADNLFINGSVFPDISLVGAILELGPGAALYGADEQLLAIRTGPEWRPGHQPEAYAHLVFDRDFGQVSKKWHIHQKNGAEIAADLERLSGQTAFVEISDPFTRCYQAANIFVEEGAIIKASIINAENGPVYIGKNAVVQEGCMIQGPFALGEGAVLAQGTKIRPNTTVGPYCKVGGEVNNCVFFAFSNKGHDGYLGNSVLGEWCNLGADTNNSNLKNDYSHVKLFSYATGEPEDTGLANCGLYMGDYSKSGISTIFNTGTVVGVHVNVFGAGFQEKFIPSFSWGGKADGYETYRLDKALAVAEMTAKSKGKLLEEADRRLLEEVYKRSALYR